MKLRFAAPLCLGLLAASVWMLAQVPNFRPVTEDMLRNPPAGDWLNWRRTYDSWGYSPLTEINKQNVAQMQLAWSWAMDDTGSQQATPLVHDGVMYLPNPRGVIQALDAATGDLIWEYRPGQEAASATRGNEQTDIPRLTQAPAAAGNTQSGGDTDRGIQRNIAIFGDRIFGATNDAHVVALDARTGKLVWDTRVADSKLGYGYTSGPIVVRGKVISGITGCSRYKDDVCFIVGHDAATGKEVWRTSTIARPGEPGGETWGNLPLNLRAGGDAWIAGSYDPETNLVYWGTAQAKPWARSVRGADGDALYTNSTLALDPDTGKMKWYYQHLPGETHDMDEVFESILIDSGGRKSLFKMGKLGILWQLDRATGAFVSAKDLGLQTLLNVDPRTGKVTYRPGKIPDIGQEVDWCPSTSGFKSWRAMSYNPAMNALYIPMNLNCEKATFGAVEKVVGGGGTGPVRRRDYKHPASDGNLGQFIAMDVATGKVLWQHRTPSPSNTAALATAGGVVFGGDWDRHMYAYDANDGKILWQSRLPTSAQGFPITYTARGKQYVAMPAGIGGGSWSTLITPELAPEIRRPNSGNVLMVFALPGAPPASITATPSAAPKPVAAAPARTVWDGVFTAQQATRGRLLFRQVCSGCHGQDLKGRGTAPGLIDNAFMVQWKDTLLAELFTRIKASMPADKPGSMSDESYRDIVAYLLDQNKFPTGSTELAAEAVAMQSIKITASK